MRILVAPDKFKGSLGAREVALEIANGLRQALPGATINLLPLADGGEGTAAIIAEALGAEWVTCAAHDASGAAITAGYAWLPDSASAIMDLSETAGRSGATSILRDPLHANTVGVGEMMLDATRRQAKEIIVGLGGSVTNDGGFGLARALGFRFFAGEIELRNGPAELIGLTRIARTVETFAAESLVSRPRIIAAADVKNPLLGPRGATQIFGRQKGASDDVVETLERALTRLAEVVMRDLGCDFRERPGAGAAGGLGFGLASFWGAEIRPGFEVVAQRVGLEAAIERADIVVTGEGSLDGQTLEGKAPFGVAQLARRKRKPVFAIVGRASGDRAVREVFDDVLTLATGQVTDEEAIRRAKELLRERAAELGRKLAQARR